MLLAISLAVAPDWFFSMTDWGARQGLRAAAAIRLVVGFALPMAARTSKYPKVFRVFGTVALIAGVTLPFIPLYFGAEYMRWWMVENASLFRWVLAVAATLFGAFVVYASLPRRTAT